MKTNKGRTINRALWTLQGLLAALFLFAGGVKLVMPLELLAQQGPLSPYFMRFIGTAEVMGALGLILPGLFRIGQVLTPVASAGLVIIMIGATVITAVTMSITLASMPMVVGLLAASIAYGRLGYHIPALTPTES
jgi:hypothetical protein